MDRVFSSSAIKILSAVIDEIDNSSINQKTSSNPSDLDDATIAWVFQINSLSSTVDSTATCCSKRATIDWSSLSLFCSSIAPVHHLLLTDQTSTMTKRAWGIEQEYSNSSSHAATALTFSDSAVSMQQPASRKHQMKRKSVFDEGKQCLENLFVSLTEHF